MTVGVYLSAVQFQQQQAGDSDFSPHFDTLVNTNVGRNYFSIVLEYLFLIVSIIFHSRKNVSLHYL